MARTREQKDARNAKAREKRANATPAEKEARLAKNRGWWANRTQEQKDRKTFHGLFGGW